MGRLQGIGVRVRQPLQSRNFPLRIDVPVAACLSFVRLFGERGVHCRSQRPGKRTNMHTVGRILRRRKDNPEFAIRWKKLNHIRMLNANVLRINVNILFVGNIGAGNCIRANLRAKAIQLKNRRKIPIVV